MQVHDNPNPTKQHEPPPHTYIFTLERSRDVQLPLRARWEEEEMKVRREQDGGVVDDGGRAKVEQQRMS